MMPDERIARAPVRAAGSRFRRRARALAVNGALLCAACAVAFALGEVSLRILLPYASHPVVPSGERGRFWQYDPELGWRHRPGATGRFRKPGVFDTAVAINAHGYRGPQRDRSRSVGTRRIVVVGDSMVWGYGVEMEQTFTRLLERDDPGLEVVNLGVSGYATDQALLLLEKEGLHYEPDLVLAEVCENDFSEILRDQVYYIYPKPRFALGDGGLELTNVPVPRVSRFDRGLFWLDTRSHLWRFVTASGPGRAGREWLDGAARRAGISKAAPPRTDGDTAGRLIVSILRRASRSAGTAGARLGVLLVAPMPDPCRRVLLRFGEEEGVPVLDLHPVFDAPRRPGEPALFFPKDRHWSPAGHRLVAGAVRDWLSATELFEDSDVKETSIRSARGEGEAPSGPGRSRG